MPKKLLSSFHWGLTYSKLPVRIISSPLLSSFHWGLTPVGWWLGCEADCVAVLFSLRSNAELMKKEQEEKVRLLSSFHWGLTNHHIVKKYRAPLLLSSFHWGLTRIRKRLRSVSYIVAVLFSLRSNHKTRGTINLWIKLLSSFHRGLTRLRNRDSGVGNPVAVLFSLRSNCAKTFFADAIELLLSSFHRGLTAPKLTLSFHLSPPFIYPSGMYNNPAYL